MRNKQSCASIWHKVNLFLSHHSINKTIMDLYAGGSGNQKAHGRTRKGKP